MPEMIYNLQPQALYMIFDGFVPSSSSITPAMVAFLVKQRDDEKNKFFLTVQSRFRS
jgi:hypothetical protein